MILFVLSHDDGLPSADVAQRAGMSPSRLSGPIDTLAEKGLVRRQQSVDDARVHQIFITQEGSDLIKRTAALTRDLNAALLAPFDEAERKTIEAFLRHVRDAAASIRER